MSAIIAPSSKQVFAFRIIGLLLFYSLRVYTAPRKFLNGLIYSAYGYYLHINILVKYTFIKDIFNYTQGE